MDTNFIQKLREKPEEHRRRVQFFLSLGITTLILIIWAVNFGADADEKVIAEKETEYNSIFGELRESFTATVEQAKEGFVILKGEE